MQFLTMANSQIWLKQRSNEASVVNLVAVIELQDCTWTLHPYVCRLYAGKIFTDPTQPQNT